MRFSVTLAEEYILGDTLLKILNGYLTKPGFRIDKSKDLVINTLVKSIKNTIAADINASFAAVILSASVCEEGRFVCSFIWRSTHKATRHIGQSWGNFNDLIKLLQLIEIVVSYFRIRVTPSLKSQKFFHYT